MKYLYFFSNDLKAVFIQHLAYFINLMVHNIKITDYDVKLDANMTRFEDFHYCKGSLSKYEDAVEVIGLLILKV